MSGLPPEIDTSRPHSARVYDYMIGGKNNFAADRETAAQVLKHSPNAHTAARENRAPSSTTRPSGTCSTSVSRSGSCSSRSCT